MLTVDTETFLSAPGVQVPKLVCLTYADQTDVGIVHHSDREKLVSIIKRALTSSGVNGFHIAYDLAVLWAYAPELGPLIWEAYDKSLVSDTMIREQLLTLAAGGTLKQKWNLGAVSMRALGRDVEKDGVWRKGYSELFNIPLDQWPDGAKRYAIDDAIAARDIRMSQNDGGVVANEADQVRAAWAAHLTTAWGVTTDLAYTASLKQKLEDESAGVFDDLVSTGLVRPDGSRNMKEVKIRLRRALKELFGEKIPKDHVTAGGDVSTGAVTCNACGAVDPVLEKFGRYGEIKSKLSRDIPLMESGIIHARYGLAESGRTTNSPNIQNLPRDGGVRECLVPRPGCVFIGADYDGLELRTIAQMCIDLLGRSNLAPILNAGGDPHLAVAANILGLTYEEAQLRYDSKDKDVFQARQAGKVANFGCPVGLGIDTLVEYAWATYRVRLTREKAADIKSNWLRTLPEFHDFFAYINQTVKGRPHGGTVTQLRSGRVRGGLRFTKACSTFSQGLGADAAKRAWWYIARDCYTKEGSSGDGPSALFGCRVVLFCHDEFLIECPEERAPAAADRLAELMCKGANEYLPDVPATTEPAIMRRYSKMAKTVYNEGTMIPWEDALDALVEFCTVIS